MHEPESKPNPDPQADERRQQERAPFPRDRDGEIYERDLTDSRTASPRKREEAMHDGKSDPGVDSQESDEFMDKQFGKKR